jgi:NAD(P)H-dependent FMN reductase
MKPKLNVIIGSTRPGRVGPSIASWFHEHASGHGAFEAVLVDLADFALPVYDEPKHPRLRDYTHEHTKRWSKSVASADAYVFVTPEYNYVAAPALINALTYVSLEWNHKPAGIVSYGGVSGGLRAAQSLKPLLTSLKVMPVPEGVPVPMFPQLMTEEGKFAPNELIVTGANTMLDELARWAAPLKAIRDAA